MNKQRLHPAAVPHMADVLKALGHPLRLRIVEALAGGERSVNQLTEDLAAPQAIVSQQLRILRSSGIVSSRREGTLKFYDIALRPVINLLDCLARCQDHCHLPGMAAPGTAAATSARSVARKARSPQTRIPPITTRTRKGD